MIKFQWYLDNGLSPNKWHAIIWANAHPIRWRKYAALERDEIRWINHMKTVP